MDAKGVVRIKFAILQLVMFGKLTTDDQTLVKYHCCRKSNDGKVVVDTSCHDEYSKWNGVIFGRPAIVNIW
jgi:hypothetical protein